MNWTQAASLRQRGAALRGQESGTTVKILIEE